MRYLPRGPMRRQRRLGRLEGSIATLALVCLLGFGFIAATPAELYRPAPACTGNASPDARRRTRTDSERADADLWPWKGLQRIGRGANRARAGNARTLWRRHRPDVEDSQLYGLELAVMAAAMIVLVLVGEALGMNAGDE